MGSSIRSLSNKTDDDRHVVIEGNTRLQIYREFLSEGHNGNWSTILAVVHDNLDAKSIDAIRLQAHLVGPRPWEPYSKARYLRHLRNSEHLTLDQIVEFCGGRRRQVLDLIDAFQDMEQHYRHQLDSDADFDASRFSAFVEYQRPNVQAAVVNSGFSKDDFARWVMDGLISPLNTVRQLPRILVNPEARNVFLNEGAKAATKVLEQPPQNASLDGATLMQLSSEFARRIGQLPFNDVQRIKRSPDGDEFGSLLDAKLLLDDLFQSLSDGSDA